LGTGDGKKENTGTDHILRQQNELANHYFFYGIQM